MWFSILSGPWFGSGEDVGSWKQRGLVLPASLHWDSTGLHSDGRRGQEATCRVTDWALKGSCSIDKKNGKKKALNSSIALYRPINWIILKGSSLHWSFFSENITFNFERWTLRLELEGGDKVPISKFGLDTSAVVFIGPIKTYLVFWIFWFGAKKTLRRSNLDLDPSRPPPETQVAQNKC